MRLEPRSIRVEKSKVQYVLDTSALRSISRSEVEASATKFRVTISPFSVWELYCHLDEPVDDDDSEQRTFLRRRGQLLKCTNLEIRDDSFAEHAREVGASSLVNSTRFDDRRIIPQILERLSQADSLESFFRARVTYSETEVGIVSDSVERCRDYLAKFEADYLESMLRLRKSAQRAKYAAPYPDLTGEEFIEIAAHGARALADSYRASGVHQESMTAHVFASIYSYEGYKLARLLGYEKSQGCPAEITLDRNDAEDAAICLHLDAGMPRALVTNDKGSHAALGRALDHLRDQMIACGDEPDVSTRVLTAKEFLEETA